MPDLMGGNVDVSFQNPGAATAHITLGFDVVANSPEQYAEFQRNEIARWSDVVKQKGLTPD